MPLQQVSLTWGTSEAGALLAASSRMASRSPCRFRSTSRRWAVRSAARRLTCSARSVSASELLPDKREFTRLPASFPSAMRLPLQSSSRRRSISQAEAALTRMVLDMSAIAARAGNDSRSSPSSHQSRAWVSSRSVAATWGSQIGSMSEARTPRSLHRDRARMDAAGNTGLPAGPLVRVVACHRRPAAAKLRTTEAVPLNPQASGAASQSGAPARRRKRRARPLSPRLRGRRTRRSLCRSSRA